MPVTGAAKRGRLGTQVGIDLGSSVVRVVEVSWDSDAGAGAAPDMLRHGSAPLAAGWWRDPAAASETLATAIRAALSDARISTGSASASLPRHLATVRFARLPQAEPDQMRGMVQFEAQQYLLFPVDEVVLDYHVLDGHGPATPGAGDLATVLLVAAKRDLVEAVVSAFDATGICLTRLTVSALAVAEHVRDTDRAAAVVALEPDQMDVAVVDRGTLLFTRSSSLTSDGARPAAESLASELALTFNALRSDLHGVPIERVYLAGGAAADGNFDLDRQALSQVADADVEALGGAALPRDAGDALGYATAVGITLQDSSRSLAPINLLPGDRAAQRAAQTRRQVGLLAAVLALALIAGAVYWGFTAYESGSAYNIAAVRANTALDEATSVLKNAQQEHDRMQAIEQSVVVGLDRRHPVVDVLAAMSQVLPRGPGIWLTEFGFARDGLLTLRGETKQESAVTDLVLRLRGAPAFTDVQLVYLGDAQDTHAPPPGAGRPAQSPPAGAATSFFAATPLPGFNAVTGTGSSVPVASTAPTPAPSKPQTTGGAPAPQTTQPPPPPAGSASPPDPGLDFPGGPGLDLHRRLPPAASQSRRSRSQAPARAVPARPPAVAAPSMETSTLTRFVITCRVNPLVQPLPPPAGGAAVSARPSRVPPVRSLGLQKGDRHVAH